MAGQKAAVVSQLACFLGDVIRPCKRGRVENPLAAEASRQLGKNIAASIIYYGLRDYHHKLIGNIEVRERQFAVGAIRIIDHDRRSGENGLIHLPRRDTGCRAGQRSDPACHGDGLAIGGYSDVGAGDKLVLLGVPRRALFVGDVPCLISGVRLRFGGLLKCIQHRICKVILGYAAGRL